MEDNQTSLKLQAVKGEHVDQWDLRGDKFVGDAEHDEHHTLPKIEIDPLSPDEIAFFESIAAPLNAILAKVKLPGDFTLVARLFDGKEH